MDQFCILLVEPDLRVCGHISRMAVDMGGSASMVHDVDHAIESCTHQHFDTIIMDVGKACEEDLQALAKLRAALPGAPIVACAADQDREDLYEELILAREHGANLVLPMPFTVQDMQDVILDSQSIWKTGKPRSHVMLVEDSRTVRKMVSGMLREKGFRVSAYNLMEDAFEGMVLFDFDVVVTDIFMPGIGGIEGVNMIRNWKPDVGVVAMSGGFGGAMGSENALKAAAKMGAGATLPKPFTAELLFSAIEQVQRRT